LFLGDKNKKWRLVMGMADKKARCNKKGMKSKKKAGGGGG
jgi:hypothetical protein